MTHDHELTRHDTSIGQANDGTDGGMHEASSWGVFITLSPAYSRSTLSTSCVILASCVIGFFSGRNACSGCKRVASILLASGRLG
jgi:hypothetical protein